MHPLHDYVAKQLAEKLKSKKLVVWSDARGEFAPFIGEVRGGPQVAMDNGAQRALIPIENKRTFLDVSADIVEHVDPIFCGDAKTAAMKVLGGLT